jgi:hypothetical protein
MKYFWFESFRKEEKNYSGQDEETGIFFFTEDRAMTKGNKEGMDQGK